MPTVREALNRFLDQVAASRSVNTHKAYGQAVEHFAAVVAAHGLAPTVTSVEELSLEWMNWFLDSLRSQAVATERLYLTALVRFYEHVASEGWASINLAALRRLRQHRGRREATRLPPFPREAIEEVLRAVSQAASAQVEDAQENLRLLRDRALLFTLADTGLRVAEACGLARGQLDWNEGRAIVLGKGNREAVVRFSNRSLRYLRLYLGARAELDGAQGRPLASLPCFARHDRAAGSRVLALSPRSAENIVERWVVAALGATARGTITPHTFRHYFVTVVLRGSGGNIRLAQELARHRSISTTQRYAHLSDDELDHVYHEIFNVDSAGRGD